MKQTNIDETKLVPIDAANMKPGDPVFLYKDGCVTEGMFVAYLPTANESYKSCIKLNDSGIPHFFTRDGRAYNHYPITLFRGPVPYKEAEPTFKIGQVFIIFCGGTYILSQVAAQTYALIDIYNGNRYRNPVKSADDASAISVATLEACGAKPSDLVENAVINVTRGMWMNKCPYCGTGTDTVEDGTRYYECGTTYHIQSGDVEQSDTCKKDAK